MIKFSSSQPAKTGHTHTSDRHVRAGGAVVIEESGAVWTDQLWFQADLMDYTCSPASEPLEL